MCTFQCITQTWLVNVLPQWAAGEGILVHLICHQLNYFCHYLPWLDQFFNFPRIHFKLQNERQIRWREVSYTINKRWSSWKEWLICDMLFIHSNYEYYIITRIYSIHTVDLNKCEVHVCICIYLNIYGIWTRLATWFLWTIHRGMGI